MPDKGPIRLADPPFLSIQGEGPTTGLPALFIRIQGCTIGCHWCDTKYSWKHGKGGKEYEMHELEKCLIDIGKVPLIVITGGEPLESPHLKAVASMSSLYADAIEIETSGHYRHPPWTETLWQYPQLTWNASPKLPHAKVDKPFNPKLIPGWLTQPNKVIWKIVMRCDSISNLNMDLKQLLTWFSNYIFDGWILPENIILMPEALKREGLYTEAAKYLVEICKANRFRYSSRLHLLLWGAKRGV